MDDAISIYNQDKLLVRAMDGPNLRKGIDGLQYDCTTWAEEFQMLMNGDLTSVSTTLIIPKVGVATYKNIGFLINSETSDCFHIAKSDSGSNGDIKNGDFRANKADFTTIKELAEYIKNNNSTDYNEVNVNTSIDAVVGLFITECPKQNILLQKIYLAKKCIKNLTGIEYPIYLYNRKEGKLKEIKLSYDQEQQIIDSLKTSQYFYWTEEHNEPIIEDLNTRKAHIK